MCPSLILFLVYQPSNEATITETTSSSLQGFTPPAAVHTERRFDKKMLAICFTNALIFLLPYLAIALPTPKENIMLGVYVTTTSFVGIPLMVVFVIAQVRPEISTIWSLRRHLGLSSLSLWTLGIQMVAFMLLGLSWVIRIGKRGTGYNSDTPHYDPFTWYFLTGWRWVNYLLYGLGQAALFFLCMYCKYLERSGNTKLSVEDGRGNVDERRPLLGES